MQRKIYFSHSRMISPSEKTQVIQAINRFCPGWRILDSEDLKSKADADITKSYLNALKECQLLIIRENLDLVNQRTYLEVETAIKCAIPIFAVRLIDENYKFFEVERAKMVFGNSSTYN